MGAAEPGSSEAAAPRRRYVIAVAAERAHRVRGKAGADPGGTDVEYLRLTGWWDQTYLSEVRRDIGGAEARELVLLWRLMCIISKKFTSCAKAALRIF